ncbi:acyltransferase [Nocardioides sp. SYSU D00038]|uniref:acyltransferase family protein n=1 Tax=Nocardioides sp. SYSU D00038 TaxID=2812554 RepID=UPI00196879B3|nr:acyltransferase [Nocardioides sp. SYSU D00038]
MTERTEGRTEPRSTGRVDGLDLLRGLAIGLVLLRHALPAPFAGAGVVGVVMFFALSGWLITGLLVEERVRTGRIDLRRFYARRARRLVPALVALVAGVVVVTLLLDPLGDRGELGRTVLFALTWTGNLPFGHASDATFHLWTLATEEQFYLVWPALLLLLGPRRGLAVAAAATTLALVATVVWSRGTPDVAYSLPTSWALCFVIGGAARVHRDRLAGLALPAWTPAVAVAGLAVLSVVPLRGHALTYLAGGPAIASLTAVLLLSWHTWTEVTGPALRALVWLGTVSYGGYLWNYPLTLWLRPHLPEAVAGVLAVGLTLAAAAASRRWVERPFEARRTTPVVATA